MQKQMDKNVHTVSLFSFCGRGEETKMMEEADGIGIMK
jgi:hypothetical protein